ncbi:MAG: hypothetical protein U0835_06405 [Isosphaeraceae bacterium]
MSHEPHAWDAEELGTADEIPVSVPRFCPRCRRDRKQGFGHAHGLCEQCGETLQDQTYCTVCENWWCLPAGADCPKHEIPLEEGHFIAADLARGTPVDWVTLETFADEVAAQAMRLRLEAEGIPTFVEGSRMGGRSMYLVATGGMKVQVPRHLLADARVLMSQVWTSPADDEIDGEGDWDDSSSEPQTRTRRVVESAVLIACEVGAVLLLIALALGVWSRMNAF